MWAAPSRELSVSPPLSQLPDRGCTVTSHPILLPPHGLSTLELNQNKPVVRSDFCWAFCHSNERGNSQGPVLSGFSPWGSLAHSLRRGCTGQHPICLLTSLQPRHFLFRRKCRHCRLSHFCTESCFTRVALSPPLLFWAETAQALFCVHSCVWVTIGVGSFHQQFCYFVVLATLKTQLDRN